MTSCTSPRDSAIGLPISRVISALSASKLSSTSRPNCWIARPRTGAGVAAQPRWASLATRHASRNVSASASAASATTTSRFAGFGIVRVVADASTGLPAMSDATVRVMQAW